MHHDEPEICNCSSLRQAARHVSRLYDRALAPAGLGVNQYTILSRLERFGPLSQRELAERLVMDRSTLGHLLRPLTGRGLIDIAPDPDDGRRKRLSLSAAGRRTLHEAWSLWADAQRRFEREFGSEPASGLRVTLAHVTNLSLITADAMTTEQLQ